MSTSRRLLKGSLFRNAEFAVLLVVSFGVTPFIVRSLGGRMYGFWTLIGAFIGYYSLMDFGLSSAAARYLSQALGKDDLDELNGVANTAFFLFSAIGLAVVLLSIACAAACPLFVSDPAEIALFRRITLMMGAAAAIGFPLRVYTGVLTSYLRYDLIAYFSMARAIAMNGAIYFHLRGGGGIMGVAVISVAASFLQNAVTYAACRIEYPRVRVTLFRYDRARTRMLLSYGWKTFVCQLGDIVRFRLDSVVIAGFLDVALLTPFSIGVRLVEGFCALVLNSAGMMLPVFSRYEGSGDYDSMRKALLTVTKLSALLSAFAGYSLLFYGPAFIRRWMGPGFESSYWIAAILTVGFILELPQSPGIQLLYGVSKHHYYAGITACEGALNLALSLLLLKSCGIYGVALGTTAELAIFKLFIQPIYICRVIGFSTRAYLVDAILTPLLKSALPLGLYFYLISGLVTPEYGRMAACLAVQTLLFAPAAYLFMLTGSERELIRHVLRVDEAVAALRLQRRPAA